MRDQMEAKFPSILEDGLNKSADLARTHRPEGTEAGRRINSFRSKLAQEIKSCYEDFAGLPPDAYHTYLFNDLGVMIRQARRLLRSKETSAETKAAILVELKAAMKEQRMVADSIAAYNASKERSAAMAGRKEKHNIVDMIRNAANEARYEQLDDEDEDDAPISGGGDD